MTQVTVDAATRPSSVWLVSRKKSIVLLRLELVGLVQVGESLLAIVVFPCRVEAMEVQLAEDLVGLPVVRLQAARISRVPGCLVEVSESGGEIARLGEKPQVAIGFEEAIDLAERSQCLLCLLGAIEIADRAMVRKTSFGVPEDVDRLLAFTQLDEDAGQTHALPRTGDGTVSSNGLPEPSPSQ